MPISITGLSLILAGSIVHVASSFPVLDPKAICSEVAGLGLGDAPATCQHGEEQARSQLKAIWPTVTAEERSLCLNPAHLSFAPSYADLFVCIRTHRDLQAIKNGAQTPSPGTSKPVAPTLMLTEEDLVQLRHMCQDAKTALTLCARLPSPN